jgi:uncharacterized protein (TIGR02466 family)
MQVYKDEWWATPIWYFDIPETQINSNLIKEECYKEQLNSKGRIKSNRLGWQSDDIYANPKIPNISDLIKTIETISKIILQDYSVKKDVDLIIDNSWININSPGSYNIPHIHPTLGLSGVYYASTPQNSGNVLFYNNFMMQFINGMILNVENKNTHNTITYEPLNGRVLIFPSWIPHSVEINNSSEDRISIAFNLRIKNS